MGATTLINVAAQVIHDRYQFGGRGFVYFIWTVWWVDVIVSFICCWIGVHVMVTQQTHTLESMTAMWLLPVVTLIVAASSGGVLGQTLNQYSTPYALWTVTVSVYMVTIGLTLALMILTIYLMRLIIHGLPPGTSILSVFLPLGPTGQSGFAIILIGDNLKALLPRSPRTTTSYFLTHEATGPIIDIVTTSVAFLLWSLATMWILANRSEYQPLSSHDDETDVGDDSRPSTSQHAGSHQRRRTLRPGSIDLTKLDNAFKRWTESIAQKVKRKKKTTDRSRKQIWRSVFEPAVTGLPSSGFVKTLDHKAPMTQTDFDAVVSSVKGAIHEGIHPKMITKGSSGSYFARAKVEGRVQTVAYISEAAASLLDDRLDLHIVPPTQLVSLSSPAFFYDWLDRNAAKKGKPLPEKIGSMQYFLHGFQDASDFLRKYPWPGRAISDTFDDSTHRHGNFSKRFLGAMKIICGRTGDADDLYDEADYEDERVLYDATEAAEVQRPFYWGQQLQQSFREELEKLVILDYLMLNTDRGADNYMIKYCEGDHDKALVDVAPSRSVRLEMPVMSELRRSEMHSVPRMGSSSTYQPTLSPVPSGSNTPNSDYKRKPHIHIAAIDNSLSFPHEHPQGWRSYTYGWLYLPRQLAVIKGQAWNIVQSLRHADEGPLELTRRTKALVWDDEIEVPEDTMHDNPNGPPSPQLSINSVPPPRRSRSQSIGGGEFPPPMRRTSTDASGAPRPVPFAEKFQRVHPGTTGVTVLEHLERLDAVEASLQRLGSDVVDEEEEDVVEVVRSKSNSGAKVQTGSSHSAPTTAVLSSPFTPPGSPPLATVPELPSRRSSIDEEDLVALSKSTSHVESSPYDRRQPTLSTAGMEWIQNAESPAKRTVIVEVCSFPPHSVNAWLKFSN
ncbi:hypothetical protein NLJ89_g658 [Agrocybe chaxingu]|uniref:Phosphatidylinositol 4-kinase n=1 Tax=Agrocybe chaxingu TaxID=84603 RepID=A0A9W8TEK6_9AGAR|nr:hypothetical protein NLJ89_g658 [Agrocybe chaxingu]